MPALQFSLLQGKTQSKTNVQKSGGKKKMFFVASERILSIVVLQSRHNIGNKTGIEDIESETALA